LETIPHTTLPPGIRLPPGTVPTVPLFFVFGGEGLPFVADQCTFEAARGADVWSLEVKPRFDFRKIVVRHPSATIRLSELDPKAPPRIYDGLTLPVPSLPFIFYIVNYSPDRVFMTFPEQTTYIRPQDSGRYVARLMVGTTRSLDLPPPSAMP
jgi:hypothetical protein